MLTYLKCGLYTRPYPLSLNKCPDLILNFMICVSIVAFGDMLVHSTSQSIFFWYIQSDSIIIILVLSCVTGWKFCYRTEKKNCYGIDTSQNVNFWIQFIVCNLDFYISSWIDFQISSSILKCEYDDSILVGSGITASTSS